MDRQVPSPLQLKVMKELSESALIPSARIGSSVEQKPATSSAVVAWQKAKKNTPPTPSGRRLTPQPMSSTLFLENLAEAMSPFAEPEPSAFSVTATGAGCSNPAIAAAEARASTPIAITCFKLMDDSCFESDTTEP